MPHRPGPRFTILQAMALIAAAGLLLGLLAAHRRDLDAVGAFLLASLVIGIPAHLAIEGNRRDGRRS